MSQTTPPLESAVLSNTGKANTGTAKRLDHEIITYWVEQNDHILDLGCGDGGLFQLLQETRNISGYGLEISASKIQQCIEKGVPVIEQNIDKGLRNFHDHAFDKVIVSMALQTMRNPHLVLDEILRVGKEAIVTFPNFGHWRTRYYLAFLGLMPMSKTLPYRWYNTPNIHLCTVKDFTALCQERGFTIEKVRVTNHKYQHTLATKIAPNLMSDIAFFKISKRAAST